MPMAVCVQRPIHAEVTIGILKHNSRSLNVENHRFIWWDFLVGIGEILQHVFEKYRLTPVTVFQEAHPIER